MRLAAGGAKAVFTGMFAADSIGLVRVSLARHQIPSFSPGLAVKMMIDGQKVCFMGAEACASVPRSTMLWHVQKKADNPVCTQSKNMVALNSLDGQHADRNVFSLPMSNVLPKPQSVPSVILNGAFAVSITSLHSTDKDPFIDHDPADRCACTRAACVLRSSWIVMFGTKQGTMRPDADVAQA